MKARNFLFALGPDYHFVFRKGAVGLQSSQGDELNATLSGVQAISLANTLINLSFTLVASMTDSYEAVEFGLRDSIGGERIEFFSTNVNEVICRTSSNGQSTETPVPLVSNLEAVDSNFQIQANANEVRFYINGSFVASHTTNIPVSPLKFHVNGKATGELSSTANLTLQVYAFELETLPAQ